MGKTTQRVERIVSLLKEHTKAFALPMSEQIVIEFGRDPYLILISCLLSLRAKDSVTLPICVKLFSKATTPKEMLRIPLDTLEKMLYSLGFFRKKAALIHEVSHELVEHFNGHVPSNIEQLLLLPGVGRKTANLVLGIGFEIPAICVDTHVHRISNRLGIVSTKTPEETEQALKKILPRKYWIPWNSWLVMWGQNICTPISPWCSRCQLFNECERVGVKQSR